MCFHDDGAISESIPNRNGAAIVSGHLVIKLRKESGVVRQLSVQWYVTMSKACVKEGLRFGA